MKSCLTLLLFTLCATIHAQIVAPADTVRIEQEAGLSQQDIEELKQPVGTLPDPNLKLDDEALSLHSELHRDELLQGPDFQELPTSLVVTQKDLRSEYPLPHWQTGYVYGSNSTQASLLYGYITTANAGIRQHFGQHWTADAQLGLQKYSVYANTASVSGQLTWQPSPYFALTAFGAYSPGSFLSPVNIGPSFQWGGYLTLQTDTNVPFGIDLGARQTYDAVFGHELVPIVQPFVKLGDAKIGIDLGPMLKEATRKQHGGNGGLNPIPQPIKAIPQVAPRR